MEKYIVDKIEGDIVTCEEESTGEMVELDAYDLPESTLEGDVIIYEDGEYTIDEMEREIREEEINKKMNNLWE